MMPYSIDVVICVMAILLSSVRLVLGRPIILAAVLVMCMSLALFLIDIMLKKQMEYYMYIIL